MGLFDRAVVTGGKAFGHIGSAIKRFGHIGGKAVKIAGDIANGVNAVYNRANDASRGALGELIRSVPGGASALHYGGKALGVYNRLAPHAHQFLTQNVTQAGDRISKVPDLIDERVGQGAVVGRSGVKMHY